MKNQLHNLLTDLKDSPRAGRVDASFAASVREQVLKLEGRQSAAPTRASAIDVLLRLPGELTDMVARPMALASLLMAMVLGGWIGGVNASLDTLPGDTFYGVKLASERAQLTLAGPATRVKLHDEFASRRIQEAEQLIQSGATSTDGRVKSALDNYQKQITGVEESLEKSEPASASVELARIVDEKTKKLETVLELTETVQDQETRDTVTEKITETEQVKEQAVEQLSQEAEDSYISRRELERQYTQAYTELRTRSELLVTRINRIETALTERGETELAFNATQLRFQATDLDLSEAQRLAAQGIYPEAFNKLAEQRTILRGIANELLEIEIALTTSLQEEEVANEQDPEPETEAPADTSTDADPVIRQEDE